MKSKFLLSSILLFASLYCAGQAPGSFTSTDFQPKMPPSPTAAGMIKYIDIPVSLSTGTPEINIPIYEINTGQLKLPISLSYHASGIKVSEDAGSTGLGWTLNATGVISRSPMGKGIDDGTWQSNNGATWLPQALDPNNPDQYALLKSLASKAIDGCPDLYNYSYPGGGGKFIITDQITLLDQKDVVVNRTITGPDEANWQIIAEDGTQYFYTQKETTTQKNAASVSNASASWYLTKIISASGTDIIQLTYADALYEFTAGISSEITIWRNGSQTAYCTGADDGTMSGSGPGINTTFTGVVTGKQLQRIDFNSGSVEFDISWNQRLDHVIGSGSYNVPKVNNVIVKDKQGNVVKVAHLLYDYYNNQSNDAMDKRLKLTNVVFNADATNVNTTDKQQYNFDYNSIALPNKNSYSQDFWGYFNGIANTTLIPTWKQYDPQESAPYCPDPLNNGFVYNGADRSATNQSVAGTLEKITYPTGGYTAFEYEPNDVPPSTPTYNIFPLSSTAISYTFQNGGAGSKTSTVIHVPSSTLYPNGLCAKLSGFCGGIPAGTHGGGGITLDMINGGTSTQIYTASFDTAHLDDITSQMLQPGDYTITIHSTLVGIGINLKLELLLPQTVPSSNRIVGGIRLKKMTHLDPVTGKTIVKKYGYVNDATGFSSGELYREPDFIQSVSKFTACPSNCRYDETLGLVLSSNSVYNIGAGSHIGYKYVTEQLADNSYSKYLFTTFSSSPVGGSLDASWRRNLLLNKKDYVNDNTLVHEINNTYYFDPTSQRIYAGLTAASLGAHPCSGVTAPLSLYPAYFSQGLYIYNSEWFYLSETIEKNYYGNGVVVNDKKYHYDNSTHKQLTSLEQIDLSDHSTLITKYHYAKDFTLTSPSTSETIALKSLQDNHIDNKPIEIYNQKILQGNTVTLNSNYLQFGLNSLNKPIISKSYKLAINGPVNSFVTASINNNIVVKDNRYSLEAFMSQYDIRDNVTELALRKGTSAYIYAYNNELPVAEVTNATQDEIAYSSFEDDGQKGNWTYNSSGVDINDHYTGTRQYNLVTGGDITKTGLPLDPINDLGKNYIISYWKKSGNVTVNGSNPTLTGNTINGWTYCEHRLNTVYTVTISGNTKVDEVRLYPYDASMKTYCYQPLVGTSEICDEKNMVARYSYDALGRLKLIKDAIGNIVKKIDYGIQQPE